MTRFSEFSEEQLRVILRETCNAAEGACPLPVIVLALDIDQDGRICKARSASTGLSVEQIEDALVKSVQAIGRGKVEHITEEEIRS